MHPRSGSTHVVLDLAARIVENHSVAFLRHLSDAHKGVRETLSPSRTSLCVGRVRVRVRVRVLMRVRVCACLCACVCVRARARVWVRVRVHVRVRVCVCLCAPLLRPLARE